jgi:hypothetical protein
VEMSDPAADAWERSKTPIRLDSRRRPVGQG